MRSDILSNASRAVRRAARWLAAPALALALAACGGGGGGGMPASTSNPNPTPSGCSAATCGTTVVTFTDATGDFTTYTVNVTSLQLTAKNGAVVETLPAATRVDFTQLVDLTELVTAAQIPNGEYVSASMTLDYTGADVEVDVNGTSTAAQTVGTNGQPLTTLTLNVELDNAHHLIVNGGTLSRLALDFNLAASNSVNTAVTPPVVTVQPFIVATVVPSATKPIRVRGTLVSVDTGAGSYLVSVEPFDDQNTSRGQVTVNTTASTTFEINGTGYTGSAGLTALDALAAGTLTVAYGSFDTTTLAFTATQVLAGTSVQMPGMDALYGIVTARSGNMLVVHGATLQSHVTFAEQFSPKDVTLSIGSGTRISVAASPGAAPTVSWPSVGSLITAFGTAGTDAGGNPTFDATAGFLRLELTSLWGFPTAAASGQVTLNLQSIEGFAPSTFNFTGTGGGTPASGDANPAAYVVTTGALPITQLMPPPAALSAGTAAATAATSGPATRFVGLVQPFGAAPPDFNAFTLVNYANADAQLAVSFGMSGSSSGFTTVSATELVLNLAASPSGSVHAIRIGPELIDLTTLAASPTIVPSTTGMGPFGIRVTQSGSADRLMVFDSYAAFEAALATALTGSTSVLKVVANGSYDATSNTFTAAGIGVLLQN
jgi:hypothetical protein